MRKHLLQHIEVRYLFPCGVKDNVTHSFRTLRTVLQLSGQNQNHADPFKAVRKVLKLSRQC